MTPVTSNKIRKFLGGFLFNLGLTNFACFVLVDLYWTSIGSHVMDAEHGLIYRHQVKGMTAYFSWSQVFAEELIVGSVVILVAAGYALVPKVWERKLYGTILRCGVTPEYDATVRIGCIAGVVSSPILIYFAGPTITSWAMSVASLV